MPVWIAESPSATERNSGTTKNVPACTKNMKKNEVTPSRSWTLRSILGSMRAPSPSLIRRFSQSRNSAMTTAPAITSQITGESPSQCGAPGLGSTNPHTPDCKTPITISPRPSAESPVPTRSSLTPGFAGLSAIRRAKIRITTTIPTSQTNTHRHDQ